MVGRGARPLAATAARFVVSVVVGCAMAVVAAPTVGAADGFRLTADTVFRLDADTPTVRVESTYRMTNTSPDVELGGGRIRSFFYTEVILPLTPGAADVAVEVDGRPADFDEREDEGYPYLLVSLGFELRYDRTATIVVRSELPGDPPRTPDSFTRVNPAYASFPVTVFADDGLGSVRVEVPEGWVTEYVGDDLATRLERGIRILEATDIAAPLDFWVAFTARDDTRLASSTVTVGDATFEIRAWPDDTDWATFATRLVSDGPPALARIVGEPWPERRSTAVIQTSTPYLRGYGGYYYPSDNSIEAGEELDGQTMLHELAHVWFNSSRIEQRWLSEGIAEAVSVAAARQLGEDIEELDDEGVEIDPFPLNEWQPPSGDDDPAEEFGYATSYLVISSLFEEIGDEARTELLSAVIRGVRAYPGEGGERTSSGAIDWRMFLDLAEQVGGAATIEGLYRAHVVPAGQLGLLDQRAATLDAYEQLADRGGTWAPPEWVRSAMAGWSFDAALDRMAAAHDALDERDGLVAALAPLGLVPSPAIEVPYEDTNGSLDRVVADLTSLRTAAARLAGARSELTDVLTGLGLDVPALTQAGYESDPIGVVDTTLDLLADANQLAATHAELDAVLDRLGLSVPPLEPGAFVDDRVAAQRRLDELRAAAETVAAAHERRAAADSLLQRIGAIGSEADRWLATADRHLSNGEPDRAIDAASWAVAAIDDLDDAGRNRLVAALAGTVLLVAVAGAVAVRRRRRPPSSPDEVAPHDDTATAVEAGGSGGASGGDPPPSHPIA